MEGTFVNFTYTLYTDFIKTSQRLRQREDPYQHIPILFFIFSFFIPRSMMEYMMAKVNMSPVIILKIMVTKGPVSLMAPQKNMR